MNTKTPAQLEREQLKQALLQALTHGKRTPAKGVSTQDAIERLREQAIEQRIQAFSNSINQEKSRY